MSSEIDYATVHNKILIVLSTIPCGIQNRSVMTFIGITGTRFSFNLKKKSCMLTANLGFLMLLRESFDSYACREENLDFRSVEFRGCHALTWNSRSLVLNER